MKRKYTKEILEPLVKESKTIVEVLSKLGNSITSSSQALVSSRIKEYNISTSHFLGKGWSKGLDTSDKRVNKCTRARQSPDELNCNTVITSHKKQKIRLITAGVEYRCSSCNLPPTWNDKPIVLEVDHINGVRHDNRICNLRFLCPNCHSQTSNYRGRGKTKKEASLDQQSSQQNQV